MLTTTQLNVTKENIGIYSRDALHCIANLQPVNARIWATFAARNANQLAKEHDALLNKAQTLTYIIADLKNDLACHWHEQTQVNLDTALATYKATIDKLEMFDNDSVPNDSLTKAQPYIEQWYLGKLSAD